MLNKLPILLTFLLMRNLMATEQFVLFGKLAPQIHLAGWSYFIASKGKPEVCQTKVEVSPGQFKWVYKRITKPAVFKFGKREFAGRYDLRRNFEGDCGWKLSSLNLVVGHKNYFTHKQTEWINFYGPVWSSPNLTPIHKFNTLNCKFDKTSHRNPLMKMNCSNPELKTTEHMYKLGPNANTGPVRINFR